MQGNLWKIVALCNIAKNAALLPYFKNNTKRLSPAGIYLLKVNSKRRSGVFVVNFGHISHLVLLFLLLTLNM